MKSKTTRVHIRRFVSLLLCILFCTSCVLTNTDDKVVRMQQKDFDVSASRVAGIDTTTVEFTNEAYQFAKSEKPKHVTLQFIVDTKDAPVVEKGILRVDQNENVIVSINDEAIDPLAKKLFDAILADVGMSYDECIQLVLEVWNNFK